MPAPKRKPIRKEEDYFFSPIEREFKDVVDRLETIIHRKKVLKERNKNLEEKVPAYQEPTESQLSRHSNLAQNGRAARSFKSMQADTHKSSLS